MLRVCAVHCKNNALFVKLTVIKRVHVFELKKN